MAEITINKEWIREAVQPVIDNVKANYIPKSVIDDIRAEILNWEDEPECDDDLYQIGAKDMQKYVLAIIDKYKAESED